MGPFPAGATQRESNASQKHLRRGPHLNFTQLIYFLRAMLLKRIDLSILEQTRQENRHRSSLEDPKIFKVKDVQIYDCLTMNCKYIFHSAALKLIKYRYVQVYQEKTGCHLIFSHEFLNRFLNYN